MASHFGHLMQSADSLEKTLILGKIEGRRRRGLQRINAWVASLTQWTWVWASSGRWWRTGKPGVIQSMGSQRVRHDERLNDNKYGKHHSSSCCTNECATVGKNMGCSISEWSQIRCLKDYELCRKILIYFLEKTW